MMLDSSIGQLWHPVWKVWGTIFGVPMPAGLHWLVPGLSGNPLAQAIGPFGIAIVLLTVGIKVVLSPIFQFQLATSRRIQAEQRKIAPQMAALRKKYKKDPQRLNQETMALYREHGINPLSQMSGCRTDVVRAPILIALYWVIFGAQKSLGLHDHHFLWIPNVAVTPSSVFGHAALAVAIGMLILPVLAGLTTFVQTKMMTPAGGLAGPGPPPAPRPPTHTPLLAVLFGFLPTYLSSPRAPFLVGSTPFPSGPPISLFRLARSL